MAMRLFGRELRNLAPQSDGKTFPRSGVGSLVKIYHQLDLANQPKFKKVYFLCADVR